MSLRFCDLTSELATEIEQLTETHMHFLPVLLLFLETESHGAQIGLNCIT